MRGEIGSLSFRIYCEVPFSDSLKIETFINKNMIITNITKHNKITKLSNVSNVSNVSELN